MTDGGGDRVASPTRALAIWGASGHGRVVADAARCGGWSIECFLDDDPAKVGGTWTGTPVRSARDALRDLIDRGTLFALGVGDNAARARLAGALAAHSATLPAVVHPSAVIADSAVVAPAVVVCAAAAINPSARIGAAAIVNTGAIIEHDCELGDYAHVSPGAALGGAVTIGSGAHVGLGAVVLPGVTVGAWAVVGAGAVVTRNVAEGVVVTGVPARLMRRRS